MSTTLLDKELSVLERALIEEYRKAYESVYHLMTDMYLKILGENGTPLVSHLYQYNRYYKLLKQLESILSVLGQSETIFIAEALEKMYADTQKQLKPEDPKIPQDEVKKIINEDWVGDGSNFSDRVWKNKAELAVKLRSDLVQAVIKGENPTKYARHLQEYLQKEGVWQALRLARTEMAHIQVRAQVDKYKQMGITKVKVICADDDRSCEKCKEMSGKILPIDSNDLPIYHQQCRCTITGVM